MRQCLRFELCTRTGAGPAGVVLINTARATMFRCHSHQHGRLETTANNTASIAQVITGSVDPNDKTARTNNGSSTVWTIDEDEWIDYLIRFQNTGTLPHIQRN
ncbi:MAG: hypothetical protein IPM46_11655 [Flavobacteriales bacterium]|nr:hypothetical protein [Flavobacteriales bacterium]